jgi:hypothetical protein
MDIRGLWEGWGRLGNLSGGCSGRCDVCGNLSIRYSRGGMKCSCERSRRKILFGSEGWVSFLLEFFVYRATLIIDWMVAATEDTFDIF